MEMGQAGMRPCGQVRQKAVKNNTGQDGMIYIININRVNVRVI